MYLVILFTVTPSFRRRFRPRRSDDSMPVRPLLDVMLYWLCTAFGGLFGSIGAVAFLANAIEGVRFERDELWVIATMTAIAPALFVVAIRSWRKLNR